MWKDAVTLSGSWIQAVGTVIAALSTIDSLTEEEYAKEKYEIVGNALQGLGNAMQAFVEQGPSLGKTGNEMQALGNTSVIMGVTFGLYEQDTQNELLEIVGNSLQSIGSALAAIDEAQDLVVSAQLGVFGNTLQSIGNGLQAVQGVYNINDEEMKEKEPNKKKNDLNEDSNLGEIEEQENGSKEERKQEEKEKKDEKDEKDETIGTAGSWIQAFGSVITAVGTTIEIAEEKD